MTPPYSMPSPVGGVSGSDFQIIKLLARKYGFITRFIYYAAPSDDLLQINFLTYYLNIVSCLLDINTVCIPISK